MTNFSIHTLDIPNLHRHAIGFERMFDELNRSFANSRADDKYPPYNISKLDDTHYIIEVAVAGFGEDELNIELKDSTLIVTGKQLERTAQEATYIHKGISNRAFERVFNLAEHVEIKAATVSNGILAIALEQVIPEEKKPRAIPISFAK